MKKVSRILLGVLFMAAVLFVLPGNNVYAKSDIYVNHSPSQVGVYTFETEIYPGQEGYMFTWFASSMDWTGLTYKSSDKSVVKIDKSGYFTGVKKGKATLTATTTNGKKIAVSITVKDYPELTYKKTKDKKGYCVTGCKDLNAQVVNIPAKYQGLPVTQIDGEAFIKCLNLRKFVTDKNQKTFYAVDGVLFTDKPEKTLVRFPAAYGKGVNERSQNTYTVPEDTKIIGDYAFAGISYISYLNIPEGVTTMGDCVFAEANWQVSVYVPTSLMQIGKTLMLHQNSNVPFYGSWDSYTAEYAQANKIPFGGVFDMDIVATTAKMTTPKNTSAKKYKVPSAKNIIELYNDGTTSFDVYSAMKEVDLTEYQKKNAKEIRIHFENEWYDIIPDKKGNKISEYPAATGIYGFGHTDKEAVLVGYDSKGKAIAKRKVSGDFIFSFDGAINIGVSGGKGTILRAMPYKPVFVTSAGNINVTDNLLMTDPNGEKFGMFVFAIDKATISIESPACLNNFSYAIRRIGESRMEEAADGYSGLIVEFHDTTRLNKLDQHYITCDGSVTVLDNDELKVSGSSSYGIDEAYGKGVQKILDTVKSVMVGTYFPAKTQINKITVAVNGMFPTTDFDSNINLSDYSDISNESTVTVLAHEMTHAVDMSIEEIALAPDSWFEGRAEYVERVVADKLGVWDSEYAPENDWSYLSKEDKKDFFNYYYFGTNRETPYEVGYYFLKYINEKYGEKISAKIMKNIDGLGLTRTQIFEMSDKSKAEAFKKCVTKVTCDTVFDDFVKEVIEK